MIKALPYFKQETSASCSLAVLRMVLASCGIEVSEKELIAKVRLDYRADFSNIWNPTIAKLAVEYGIQTTMYALWPLFKPELTLQALKEFRANPEGMNINKYENPNDSESLPEPLSLAYKEMFLAIEKGCKTVYGGLTEKRLTALLNEGFLIQTSVKLHKLYPAKKKGFHSILIYKHSGDGIEYHDPYHGEGLRCTAKHLLTATNGVGAFMAYKRVNKG